MLVGIEGTSFIYPDAWEEYLAPIISEPGKFHFAIDYKVKAGRRLVLVVDYLVLATLRDGGAWQMG